MIKRMDYIYYRIAKFFYKSDGNIAMGALVILSMSEVLILSGILTLICRLFYTLEQIRNFNIGGKEGVIVYFLLIVVNYLYYRNKYEILKERWDNESERQQRLRGILVVIAIFLPFAMLYYVISTSSNYR